VHDPQLFSLYLFGTLLITAFSLAVIISLVIQKQRQVKARLARQKLEFEYSQSLLNTRIEVQENTLNMLARELHDNVAQSLTACFMQVSTAGMLMTSDRGKEIMHETKENITNTIRDVRLLSHSLATGMVEQRDLHEVIQAELSRIEAFSNISCTLRSDTIYEPEPEQRLLLFRIVQEAIQNILKHARATSITIRLGSTEDHYNLSVTDNGCGFDLSSVRPVSLGLASMEERVALLKGSCTIDSKPGSGTTINIHIPLKPAAQR
jgi:hypothetical protein